MFFSIIVPVYNVEKYISSCLDSLLDQKMKDYEIILINDGSKDKSGEICKNYAQKDPIIKYFIKENGGLSDARNYGIEKSSGEYIIFVDSDDWIRKDILAEIKDSIIQSNYPDVVITRITEVIDGRIREKDIEFPSYASTGFTKEKAVRWNFLLSEDTSPAIKNIVSKKLIEKNELRFLKNRLHEDLDWTSRLFVCANTFSGFSSDWYYYRLGREGSITNSMHAKNYIDTIEIVRGLFDSYKDSENKDVRLILNRSMVSVYSKLNSIDQCKKSEWDDVIKCIKKNKCIFKIAPSIKYKIFVVIMRLLGPRNALLLLSTF